MKLSFADVIDLPLSDTIRVPAHESPAVVEAIRVTSEVRIRVAARVQSMGRRAR